MSGENAIVKIEYDSVIMDEVLTAEETFLCPERPLRVQELHSRRRRYGAHGHEFTEFAVVLSGRGRHILDGAETELQVGDCFVIAPGRVHAFESLSDFRVINVLFLEAELLARIPSLAGLPGYRGLLHWEPALRDAAAAGVPVRLPEDRFALVVDRLRCIEAEGTLDRPGATTAMVCALGEVMVELCRAFCAAGAPAARFASLERAIAYVERHYARSFGIAELAAAAAQSPASLLRSFRAVMGCTPMEYVRRERLRRAAILLEDPALTVSAIARMTGFVDASHLNRSFRTWKGVSAREYRQGRH